MKDLPVLQEPNQLHKHPVNLPKFYITEGLDKDSLRKILDSAPSVYLNLLLIKNGVKPSYDFATLDSSRYTLVASVKVSYAIVGAAKAQAWSVTHFKPVLGKKPKYEILCGLKDMHSNKFIYKNTFISIKPEAIYNRIQSYFEDLQILLDSY